VSVTRLSTSKTNKIWNLHTVNVSTEPLKRCSMLRQMRDNMLWQTLLVPVASNTRWFCDLIGLNDIVCYGITRFPAICWTKCNLRWSNKQGDNMSIGVYTCINNLFIRPSELMLGPTKGGKLCNIITHTSFLFYCTSTQDFQVILWRKINKQLIK